VGTCQMHIRPIEASAFSRNLPTRFFSACVLCLVAGFQAPSSSTRQCKPHQRHESQDVVEAAPQGG